MRSLLLLAFASSVYAQTCAGPEYAQQDNLLGAWTNSAGEQVLFRKAVAGCAIVEDRADATKGVLFHDPATKAWRHVSISPTGLVRDGTVTFDPKAWTKIAALTKPVLQATGTCPKDFDFWLGKWHVTSPRGARVGVNHIYPAASGCVLVENWTNSTLNPGMSLNFYDKAQNSWRQIWVAPGGILDLRGKWNGSTLQFASKDGFTRLTFTPNQDGSVRQFWEQSNDSGKTWFVSFDGTYTKAPAPPTASAIVEELNSASEATRALFEALSEEQSRFRQNPDRWSLQEILDHLVESERLFSAQASKLLVKENMPPPFHPGPVDALLIPIATNRNRKLNAPEEIRPKSASKSTADLLVEFQTLRAATIELLRTADPAHLYEGAFATHPLGSTPLSAGHWLAVAAAHNRRHLDQADEVLRDPRFPSTTLSTTNELDHFTGHWSGDGTFQGKPVRVEASWTPTLGGKFHELSVKIRLSATASFVGRAMYHASTLKASWSDSMGNAYGVDGRFDGGTLTSDWNNGKGRSTYALDAATGELVITDAADGKEFGRYRLKRSTAQPAIAWDIRPHNGAPWKAIYESGAMLVGVYNLAVGAKDEQAPHEHDEIYFVESGQAILDAGTQRFPVQAGSMVMVRKGVSHRFHSVEQALKALVFFSRIDLSRPGSR